MKTKTQKWRFCYSFYVKLGFALFLLPLSIPAQNITSYLINKKGNFDASTVYEIVQDSLGYIWMGSDNGLFRYDGLNEFKAFRDSSILDPEVFGLISDAQKKLWFRNGMGQVVNFHHEVFDILPQFGPGKIKADHITMNEAGTRLYIYSKKAIYAFDIATQTLQRIASFKIELDSYVNFVSIYQNTIVTIPRFPLLQVESPDYKTYALPDLPEELLHKITPNPPTFHSFKFFTPPHKKDVLFVLVRNYFFPFDLKSKSYKISSLDQHHCDRQFIRNLSYHPQDGYRFCTENGLYAFDLARMEITKTNILPQKPINNILKDREGGDWIGVMNEGLYYTPYRGVQQYSSSSINTLFVSSRNDLLVGTSRGIVQIIDPQDNFREINLEDKRRTRQFLEYKKHILVNSASGNATVLRLKEPAIVGTLNGSGQKARIIKDRIYISKYTGLYEVKTSHLDQTLAQLNSKKVTRILPEFQHRHFLNYYKNIIASTDNEGVWLGGIGELDYFSVQDSTLHYYDQEPKSFPYQVNSMVQDAEQTLWLATAQNGLLKIREGKVVQKWTTDDGLPANGCQAVLLSASGFIWVGTSRGLVRLNPQTGSTEIINQSEGLSASFISCLAERGAYIWVGTTQGLFKLHHQIITKNEQPPECTITRFRIWEQDTIVQNHYRLSHQQNNINISFISNIYRSLGNHQYRYRMLGIDSSWVSLPASNNFVRFPQLAPGSYLFELKVINEDGVESLEPSRISIEITTPFWQTWWFSTLLILGLSGAIIALSTFFRKRREQLKALNQRIEDLQIKSLIAQMNPHFIFNALNSIQYYIFREEREASMRYLNHFSNMIRTIFLFSQKTEVSLEEELAFIQSYLQMEKMRLEEKVKIEVDIDPALALDKIKIPPLLIQPLLENCFKHGLLHKKGRGEVALRCKRKNNELRIEIQDNGIGRKAARKISWDKRSEKRLSSSAIIQNRIDLINSKSRNRPKIQFDIEDLYDAQNQAKGTRVRVVIPLTKEL